MRLFLAAAALLLALAPGAALAHGDASHAAAESAPKVFAHPSCPGGGGECCCRAAFAPGGKPPAVATAHRHMLVVADRYVPQAAAVVRRGAKPHSLARSRAPPLFL
jgi:hypothetical protein